MDPTKNYIKLAGQPVQEIENVSLTDVTLSPGRLMLCFNPVPRPEKSLQEEIEKEYRDWTEDKWVKTSGSFTAIEAAIIRVIERKLKALKE